MPEEEGLKEKREKIVGFVKNLFKKEEKGEEKTVDAAEEKKEEIDLKEKRTEFINVLKRNKKILLYLGLIIIVILGIYIRTLNINLLRDQTTNDYTPISLDDPFVFFRYAQYVNEHGSLMNNDTLRYYPRGYEIYSGQFLAYFIAYLYKFINIFDSSATLAYADVIYPVVTFVIGLLFFFLLVARLFDKKIALLSTLFLTIIPAYLHRTIAGFSDHEALGMIFFFMALYLYVVAWQSKKVYFAVLFGVLSGIATVLMALAWGGGVNFIYIIIGGFTLVELFLGKLKRKDYFIYLFWFLSLYILIGPLFYGDNYLGNDFLLKTFNGGIMIISLAISTIYFFLIDLNILKIKDKVNKIMPEGIFSLIVFIILAMVFVFLTIGPYFIYEQGLSIYQDLTHPWGKDRWQLTVAEQHQPYFTDWLGQMSNSWLFILLFLIGSVYLFYQTIKPIRRRKIEFTIVYALFILAFIFSRYSRDSAFNGENAVSKLLYIGSLIIFILVIAVSYIYIFYKNKEVYEKIPLIDQKYSFIFIWFLLMVVAARGAIRLLFIFAPIVCILAGYFIMELFYLIPRILKDKIYKILAYVLLFFILISPFGFAQGIIYKFYNDSKGQAKYSGTGNTPQWQMAGKWIRENTEKDAVFAHWWDYGYWVQTAGQRTTITDPGNEIGWWNYLMGRMVLTGQNKTEALQFLKAHDANYLLIVEDDIGKYSAYSSIGSDVDYDRYSWMVNFGLDPTQTQETRNETIYFYRGGWVFDEDFIYNDQVFPARQAGIGAVLLPVQNVKVTQGNQTIDMIKINQPLAAVIYNGKRTDIPIENAFFNDNFIKFEKPGLKGVFRIMLSISNNQQNNLGSGIYVSERVSRTIFANLYLFNQKNPDYDTSAFELAYDDSNNMPLLVYNGREIGPLRIWKINYGNFTISEKMKSDYIGREHLNPEALKPEGFM